VGDIAIFTENLDAKRMKAILQKHLIKSARRLVPSGQWWLLQDHDPKHDSVMAKTWIHNHGVDQIDFPAYSPDLNPIENLWNNLKRRVEAHNARNIEELKQPLYDEWYATSKDFLVSLVESMPQRCKAVIESKGHKIKY
jgi:DDE superfamily endonuclease